MAHDSAHPSAPSVFLSSTVYDLKDLRAGLAYVLRSQGVIVYASEAAEFEIHGDRGALDECYDKVRASDVYVLILGGRKGSILEDGYSVTRHEYRVALESFMTTGSPRLWMYVRDDAESSLEGDAATQSAAQVDDPEHLKSFLEEIRQPQAPGTPNWISPFQDAADLIEGVLANLNLGRNFWESVVRHSLVSELAGNLALISSRVKTTAVPAHQLMGALRKKYGDMGTNDFEGTIDIDGDDRLQLVLALFPSKPFVSLRDEAVMQAINGGVFLAVDQTSGALTETPMHRELSLALADIHRIKNVEISLGEFLTHLIADLISPSPSGSSNHWIVRKSDLSAALGLFDRLEDLFKGHVAICSALLTGQSDPAPYDRSPLSPFGEKESARMKAEGVSPAEIRHLITNDIYPFGLRVMADTYGSTEDEQVQTLTKSHQQFLKENLPDIEIPSEIIESASRAYLKENSPKPDEGLEDLRPKEPK